SSSRATLTIAVLFTAFIFLAMPGAIIGVGWPAIRDEFGLRQDSIGLLLIMGTIGHLISGAFNGRLMYRFGGKNLLRAAMVIFGLSLYGYWLTPSWIFLVIMGLLGGWAAGTVDATANTIVAARYNERIMNWLHGFFGIGATLGPLVISLVIAFGSDWRGSAFVFGTLLLILFAAMWLLNPMGDTAVTTTDIDNMGEESATSGRTTLKQPIVWMAILFFFVYGGIEVSIGQWSFTLFTESRGLSDELARYWVSIYWGTFTIGRFVFGIISPWFPAKTWLRGCIILTVGSIALLLFPSNRFLGLAALALSGVAQAPVFATLISMMPRLVGREHASNAIGYVVGAAGVGIAILPSLGGILAEQISLESIPPFILVQGLALMLLFELLMRQHAHRSTQQPKPAPVEQKV
ncbi:MAG: MFS transporter, partial [Anaerolineales bacterium]|nr:MFS transporter [Anaerolineales bacterium]